MLGLLGAIALSGRTAAASAQERDPLRILAPSAARAEKAADPLVLRSRSARVSLDGLLERDALVLDLFDGVACAALRSQNASDSGSAWVGRIPEDDGGSVHLVVHGRVLVGSVRLHRALYRIRPTDDPLDAPEEIVVEEIDESRFPDCAIEGRHGVSVGAHVPANVAPQGQFASTAPAEVDVLVAYTPQARAAAGGQAAIHALIQLAVLESNTIYENSQAAMRLRLVHTAEVAYTESGSFSTELQRLQNPTDGFLDTVHALRNTHGADAVTLIVNGNASCGIGYVMLNASASFQAYAFNVVSRSCATGYYSFAHELGHNLGCAHDRQTGGTGLFPYSYGYRNPAATWRTVMAYAPGARIPYFSNPSVGYQGQPTGAPSTSPLGCDNALTISSTAPIMAAFRAPAATEGGALAYGLGKTTSIGLRPTLAWTGTPSVAANAFSLQLSNAIPTSLGFVHVASQSAGTPFQGGTLYAAPPIVPWKSFRTLGDGTVAVSVPLSAPTIGQTRYYQAFFRDTQHPDGTKYGMSNGVQVTCAP